MLYSAVSNAQHREYLWADIGGTPCRGYSHNHLTYSPAGAIVTFVKLGPAGAIVIFVLLGTSWIIVTYLFSLVLIPGLHLFIRTYGVPIFLLLTLKNAPNRIIFNYQYI